MDYEMLWLGDAPPELPPNGQAKPLGDVPSLMCLIDLPQTPPCAIVLDFRAGCPYSVPHVLSAAQLLAATRHRLFLLKGGNLPESLVSSGNFILLPETVQEALAKIGACMKKRGKPTDGSSRKEKPEKKRVPSPASKEPPPALELYGMILILAVAGSQSRIGCTTQAFALWHYCKSLGLQTAIVMPPDAAALLAKFMDGQQREGGVVIGEIPIVDGMTYEFDCYIQDLGVLTPDNQKQFQDADCGILVMGGKPWELTFAAKALSLTQGQRQLLLLVSFCTDGALSELKKVFPGWFLAAADWRPDPFQPQTPDFDAVLRPLLEQAIFPDLPFEP